MLKRAHCFAVGFSAAAAATIVAIAFSVSTSGCQSTCMSSADCGPTSYCSLGSGVCLTPQALGFCKDLPASHSTNVVPVCGCDGKTYINADEAAFSRVSVAAMGACSTQCGGPAALTCPDPATYCRLPDGVCGTGSMAGTCDTKPTSCAGAPQMAVCGCDGKTYNSLCDAQVAGVSLQASTSCACGGANSAKCGPGSFCELATGMCAMASSPGTCTVPPTMCTAVSSPVCGCDGKTYPNACFATKAQQSVFALGACPCAGPMGQFACQPGEYCEFPMTGGCLDPSALGTCQPRPTTCVSVPSPVCGCDFMPYNNICEAARTGGVSAAFGTTCPDAGPDAGDAGPG